MSKDKAPDVVDPVLLGALKQAKDALREPLAACNALERLMVQMYKIGPTDHVEVSTGKIIRSGGEKVVPIEHGKPA